MTKRNVVIKKECHSRFCRQQDSEIYNICRYHNKEKALSNKYVEDPRLQLSGMTALFNTPSSPLQGTSPARGEVNNALCAKHPAAGEVNGGFTLIELLVVVLIIGILAAVAVPQYRFATDKARLMPYVQKVSDILKAEQLYYLANGEYTFDLSLLDIDLTKICPKNALGANATELFNCPGGVGFNITPSIIQLNYCAETSSSCSTSTNNNLYMRLTWMFGKNSASCTHNNTARGKKLCDYFTQQLGTN